jgi:hypothetical protein
MAANYFNKYQQPEIAKAGEKENIEAWTDRYVGMIDAHKGKSTGIDTRKEIEAPEIELE